MLRVDDTEHTQPIFYDSIRDDGNTPKTSRFVYACRYWVILPSKSEFDC